MELLPVENDSQWGALLEEQPNRSLYHTTAWLRFQAEQFGYELHRLVIHHQGESVGLFPLFLTRRAIFRVASSPRGVDYLNLGPLVSGRFLGETLDCYERWARENGVDYTAIAFMREIDNDVAKQRGYKCERHLLCLGDLRGGVDAVFKNLMSRCSRSVRKAERSGVEIVEGDIGPYLDRYLEWSGRIYAKSGKPSPLSSTILSGMLSALSQSGHLLTLRAQVDQNVIGMYIIGHYGKTAYSLNIVADPAFSRIPASNLMTWHAMRWCCRHGLDTFDFGGARIAGIAQFKQSFGGALVGYTNITKAHSLLACCASRLAAATIDRIRSRKLRRSRKGRTSSQLPARAFPPTSTQRCDSE